MCRFLIAAATAGALISTAAVAADLPTKAPAPAPFAPVATWSGFYAGLNAGYGWARRDAFGDLSDSPCCVKPRGGFGGVQLGYNAQFSQWVLGIETDLQGSGISKTVNDLNFGDTLRSKTDWFGTLRGRLGVAFNPAVLLYITGGLAYGQVNNSAVGPVLSGSPYNIDRTHAGYVLGGGFEYKIAPSWSVKAEYQYINLRKNDPTNPAGQPFDQFSDTFVHVNDFHTVRLGLNYFFMPR